MPKACPDADYQGKPKTDFPDIRPTPGCSFYNKMRHQETVRREMRNSNTVNYTCKL
jgi:hypothetical protein